MAFKLENGGVTARVLAKFDFIIAYRKGSENQNADALSRQFEQLDSHSAAIILLVLNSQKI